MSSFIDVLTFSKLSSLILEAKKRVIYCSSNIHFEVSTALSEASKKGVEIFVIIDPSEDNYRSGFGDIKSIDLLEKYNVKIFEVKGNNISFIITDDLGYIFFPQSKIFFDEPSGPNALKMDEFLKHKIIYHYFPAKSLNEKKEFENNIIELAECSKKELKELVDNVQNDKIESFLKEIDKESFNKVKNNLEAIPPILPDIKRLINTYSTKVKFVELRFRGAKFYNKRIKIPNDALPFKDSELKKLLETKLKLFSDAKNNLDIKKFSEIEEKINKLKANHFLKKHTSEIDNGEPLLIPLTCRENKSIIKASSIKKFEEKISEIREELEKFKKRTLENLEIELLNRKESLQQEIFEFLNSNPPAEYQYYNPDFRLKKIKNDSIDIVSKIKFPEAKELVEGAEIKYNFYDLTFEDFKDDELIKEFRKKNIITTNELNEIVSFRKAFEIER